MDYIYYDCHTYYCLEMLEEIQRLKDNHDSPFCDITVASQEEVRILRLKLKETQQALLESKR